MRKKITVKEAMEILYVMWEDGLLPSNFTEDHSEYGRAIHILIKTVAFSISDLSDNNI